jgi:hypothetical protein
VSGPLARERQLLHPLRVAAASIRGNRGANKCLAQNNKSNRAVEATKKHAIGWMMSMPDETNN